MDALRGPRGGTPPRRLTLAERLDAYERLMRLDKPIGTLLLLWPTLWALWIASGGRPGWLLTWIFCLGTLLMRSAGCVMNDLADRDFDAHVKRTKDRPLAAGQVSVKEALWLAAGLTLAAFCLVLAFNRLTIALSFAALGLAATYPFTKRFFSMPQAYLGVAFGFAIAACLVAALASALRGGKYVHVDEPVEPDDALEPTDP